MPDADTTTAARTVPSAAAEAARYALLRRLAPSMRHHLVVNLQPIGMIYEVMERRLRAPQPDLGSVQESAAKINGFARAALNSCIDVVSWLAPDDTARISLAEGTRECAGLLATSLSFRGYTLRNEVGEVASEVRRASLRTLLTAGLLHVADHRPPPATLKLRATERSGALALLLELGVAEGDKGFPSELPYRALNREDLQALADAEGVTLVFEQDALSIVFPPGGA